MVHSDKLLSNTPAAGGHSALSHFTIPYQQFQDQFPNEQLVPNCCLRLCFWENPIRTTICYCSFSALHSQQSRQRNVFKHPDHIIPLQKTFHSKQKPSHVVEQDYVTPLLLLLSITTSGYLPVQGEQKLISQTSFWSWLMLSTFCLTNHSSAKQDLRDNLLHLLSKFFLCISVLILRACVHACVHLFFKLKSISFPILLSYYLGLTQ